MDYKHIIVIIIIWMATFCVNVFGINTNDYFFHISTYGNEINSIYRDQESGIVWLGSNKGLFKHDNSLLKDDFQYIYPDILSYGIRSVQGMQDGNLLLYSITHQYILYNPISNTVKTDFKSLFREWGIEDSVLPWQSNIVVDKDKNLWIYSGNRLWCYNKMLYENAILKVKTKTDILQLCIGDNNFYVLTDNAMSCYDKKSSKLLYATDWIFSKDSRDLKMIEDKYGNIWVGGENLYRYVIRESSWKIIKKNLSVTEMTSTINGDIYIASSSSGIIHYNPMEDKIESIKHNPFDVGSLKSNRLHSIFADTEGNLWVSYNKQDFSISNYTLRDFCIEHIASLKKCNINDDIISLSCDRNGVLWMGTDGNGLYNSVSSDSSYFVYGSPLSLNDNSDAVTSLYNDSCGRLWFGLYRKGLFCMNGKSLKTYLNGMSPYSIVETSNGDIYVGTLGNGLYCLSNGLKDKPKQINTNGRQYIMQIFCDNNDSLYIATTSGLQILDTNTGKSEFFIGNRSGSQNFFDQDLQSVYKDSRGLLWLIGLHDKISLSVFNMMTDTIMPVEELKDYRIKSIIEDDDNTMWAAFDNGILNIKVRQEKFGQYSFKTYVYKHRDNEEKFNNYNYRSVVKTLDGTLFFGKTNGYRKVVPIIYNNLRVSDNFHKVCWSLLKINKKVVEAGMLFNGRKVLERDISVTSSINLRHYENNLSLCILTQDYGTPFRTDYYYKLENLNDNWQLVENDIIEISNLPPGNYQLSVKGRNCDNSMTDVLTSLNIYIAAPWYMTTWAYLFYVVILLVIILVVFFYIIERQRQSMLIQETSKEIERQHQLNESKLRFFTNISHDLRTPLTLIITPLESYLNNNKENPDVNFFIPIYKNAVRLLNLINQLLDFRKLEVYGASFNPSNGDIVSFIQDLCSSFKLYAEDTHIDLQFSSTEALCYMSFDKDKISKIMMNLLSNAFKHTSYGGRVYVKLIRVGKTMQISVMDNGCGIPDNEKEAIFQRFYQNNCDNTSSMGCGIGLHIVKEFVKLHHGTITVTDNIPTGVVFTVSLAIEEIQLEDNKENISDQNIDSNNQDSETEVENRTLSLLLVDDNEEFLDFLSNSFADDYNIYSVTNGVKALELIEEKQIDLVVSDVMMDEMNGLELCKRIKTDIRYSHIPVILLTAKTMIEDEIQGFEIGADDYITKPFNLSILKLRIQNMLKNRERSYIKFQTKVNINPSEITITSLDEQFLSQAISIVEENISDPDFSVESLSDLLGIHRTHLYRKLSSITGKTPIEFIRLIRLKRAKQYLEQSQMYISEIAYAVGFNSPKLFSKYFKMEFNISPKDYANKNIIK